MTAPPTAVCVAGAYPPRLPFGYVRAFWKYGSCLPVLGSGGVVTSNFSAAKLAALYEACSPASVGYYPEAERSSVGRQASVQPLMRRSSRSGSQGHWIAPTTAHTGCWQKRCEFDMAKAAAGDLRTSARNVSEAESVGAYVLVSGTVLASVPTVASVPTRVVPADTGRTAPRLSPLVPRLPTCSCHHPTAPLVTARY